jgi:hypothetical protein
MVWLHGKSKLDMDFTTNYKGFRLRFSLKPIQWGCWLMFSPKSRDINGNTKSFEDKSW